MPPVNVRRRGRGRTPTGRARGRRDRGHLYAVRPTALQSSAMQLVPKRVPKLDSLNKIVPKRELLLPKRTVFEN